jgi:hypothetical protein
MHSIAKSISFSIAAVLLLGTAAIADPAPTTADKAAASDSITTGSVYVEPTADQRMADCMAIWEPATHMTKQQWRRTCKMSLKELSAP